ncbi:hypothetical protein JCM14469_26360 [Desulfatiferula olefinivorans]
MTSTGKKDSSGMMKSIFAAHLILVLHVLLIAGLGCLILFFGVIVQYLVWILIIGSAGIFLAGYLLKRKMVREGKQLRDMLSLPAFTGRTIEVSILGGMASLRLENPGNTSIDPRPRLAEHSGHLIDSGNYQLRELSELADLYKKNLITLDEYNKFKTKLINS